MSRYQFIHPPQMRGSSEPPRKRDAEPEPSPQGDVLVRIPDLSSSRSEARPAQRPRQEAITSARGRRLDVPHADFAEVQDALAAELRADEEMPPPISQPSRVEALLRRLRQDSEEETISWQMILLAVLVFGAAASTATLFMRGSQSEQVGGIEQESEPLDPSFWSTPQQEQATILPWDNEATQESFMPPPQQPPSAHVATQQQGAAPPPMQSWPPAESHALPSPSTPPIPSNVLPGPLAPPVQAPETSGLPALPSAGESTSPAGPPETPQTDESTLELGSPQQPELSIPATPPVRTEQFEAPLLGAPPLGPANAAAGRPALGAPSGGVNSNRVLGRIDRRTPSNSTTTAPRARLTGVKPWRTNQ